MLAEWREKNNALHVVSPQTKSLVISRDVLFLESQFTNFRIIPEFVVKVPTSAVSPLSSASISTMESLSSKPTSPIQPSPPTTQEPIPPLIPRWQYQTLRDYHIFDVDNHQHAASLSTPFARAYTTQQPRNTCNFTFQCNVIQTYEPIRAKEALAPPKLKAAMEVELYSIERNHTWEVVQYPQDRQVICLT